MCKFLVESTESRTPPPPTRDNRWQCYWKILEQNRSKKDEKVRSGPVGCESFSLPYLQTTEKDDIPYSPELLQLSVSACQVWCGQPRYQKDAQEYRLSNLCWCWEFSDSLSPRPSQKIKMFHFTIFGLYVYETGPYSAKIVVWMRNIILKTCAPKNFRWLGGVECRVCGNMGAMAPIAARGNFSKMVY